MMRAPSAHLVGHVSNVPLGCGHVGNVPHVRENGKPFSKMDCTTACPWGNVPTARKWESSLLAPPGNGIRVQLTGGLTTARTNQKCPAVAFATIAIPQSEARSLSPHGPGDHRLLLFGHHGDDAGRYLRLPAAT